MPGSDWRLFDFGVCYRKWRGGHPSPEVRRIVREWAKTVIREGPPVSALDISGNDEDFVDWIDGTTVFIYYFVSRLDELVAVRLID